MNNNEAMTIVLKWMIAQAKNKEYISKLESILRGIEGKKNIEEINAPRYMSILFWGYNIFPFTAQEYIAIATEIVAEGKQNEI
jgi:hypothetical protein